MEGREGSRTERLSGVGLFDPGGKVEEKSKRDGNCTLQHEKGSKTDIEKECDEINDVRLRRRKIYIVADKSRSIGRLASRIGMLLVESVFDVEAGGMRERVCNSGARF